MKRLRIALLRRGECRLEFRSRCVGDAIAPTILNKLSLGYEFANMRPDLVQLNFEPPKNLARLAACSERLDLAVGFDRGREHKVPGSRLPIATLVIERPVLR
jgi:hypothetical protein